jgi:predicted phage terminase large subunit-like protein
MISNCLSNFIELHDELAIREKIRTNLSDWALNVLTPAGLILSAHHRFLLNKLSLVTNGDIKRLMVLMPPGSAKSTYASVIFPIWWFIQHPRSSIIAASHTAALVDHFSRTIRGLINEHHCRIGLNISEHDRSAKHWRTTNGGEYFGVGIRGAITGRRADLVIIDDPVKSMGEADSAKHRQHVWEWYTSELITRLKPEARIVLVMTRWHEQDLGGQLIARSDEDWHVARLPAIAEQNDPIGRPPGAPLWPEWEALEALNKKRAVVGTRVWSALFQQSPQSPAGHLFNLSELRLIGAEKPRGPTPVRTVRAWDLAATGLSDQNDPDWSVGLKLVQEEGGRYVVEDVIRLRGDFRTVQETILSVARSDGHAVVISLPIDPGQAGKGQIATLSSLLSGYRLYTSREQGSKLTRALLASVQIETGNFCMREASWNQAFTDELRSFPQGAKDDQVDALSRAFITLSDFPSGGRRLFVPFNTR